MLSFLLSLFSPISILERAKHLQPPSDRAMAIRIVASSFISSDCLCTHNSCSDSVDTRSSIALTFSSYLINLCFQQYKHIQLEASHHHSDPAAPPRISRLSSCRYSTNPFSPFPCLAHPLLPLLAPLRAPDWLFRSPLSFASLRSRRSQARSFAGSKSYTKPRSKSSNI